MVDTLNVGDELGLGQALQGGAYTLTLQNDGNLVLSEPGGVVWATNTHAGGVRRAVLQEDGNFVLYTGDGPVWATDTDGKDVERLVVQADRNGGAVWQGRRPAMGVGHQHRQPDRCRVADGRSSGC